MSPSGPKDQGRADAAGKPGIAETTVAEGRPEAAGKPRIAETVVAKDKAEAAGKPRIAETVVAEGRAEAAGKPRIAETVVVEGRADAVGKPRIAENVVAECRPDAVGKPRIVENVVAECGPEAAGKPRIAETVVVEGKDDQSAVLAALDANVLWTHGYGINSNTLELIGSAAERTGIVIFTDPDHAGRQIRERLKKLWPDAKQAFLTQAQAEKAGDIGIENAKPEDILRALTAAGCWIEWPDGTRPEKGCRTDGAGEVRRIYGAGNGRRAEGAGEGCRIDGAGGDSRTEGAGGGCRIEWPEGTGPEKGCRAVGACEGRAAEKPAKKTPVTMDDLVALGLAGGPQSAEKRALAGARLGIGSANSKAFLRRLSFMGIGLEELAEACR